MLYIKTEKDLRIVPDCYKTLNLENMSISRLPISVKKLAPYLSFLHLSDNMLRSLPDNLFKLLPHLKWLDVRFNTLTKLPKSLQNHQSIQTLLLQNNLLERLPSSIVTCNNLVNCQLTGNPLKEPPQSYIEEGMYGIMKYFMEIGEFNQPVEYQDQSSMYQAEWNRLNQIYIIDHFLKKFKVSIDEDEDSSDEEFDRIRKTAFMKRRIMRKERIMKLRKRELARDKLVVQISRHWRHCVFLSRVSLKVKEKKLDKRFFDKISNHESRLDDLSNKMKDIGFSDKENSVKTKKNGKIFFN